MVMQKTGMEGFVDPRVRRARKTFTPNLDYVSIQWFKRELTDAGLIIPEGARTGPESMTGLVVGVGPEVQDIEEGDQVMMADGVMYAIIDHGRQPRLALIKAKDIGGVVSEEYKIHLEDV